MFGNQFKFFFIKAIGKEVIGKNKKGICVVILEENINFLLGVLYCIFEHKMCIFK